MGQDIYFVRLDENGVYRVGNTRVMCWIPFSAGFHQAHTPAESIMQQYPALSLAEVYGSIAYYLTHSWEIDAYMNQQALVWEQERIRGEQRPESR